MIGAGHCLRMIIASLLLVLLLASLLLVAMPFAPSGILYLFKPHNPSLICSFTGAVWEEKIPVQVGIC